MILIIGSNHDDVLYYESLLKKTKEEVVLSKYHVLTGAISSREVMILQDIYTSFVSSTITSYLISHYFISIIICVGRCEIVKGSMRVGDIAVSDSLIFGDVDQIATIKGTELGQIPGYPRIFPVRLEMLNNMNKCLDNVTSRKHYNSTFISSSFFRQNKELIDDLSEDEYIQSLDQNIVLDGESAGVALACYLHDVPFISVKVAEANIGEYTTLDNYLSILSEYANLGKAIAAFIGEISRTDIVRA